MYNVRMKKFVQISVTFAVVSGASIAVAGIPTLVDDMELSPPEPAPLFDISSEPIQSSGHHTPSYIHVSVIVLILLLLLLISSLVEQIRGYRAKNNH